ncbi:hypothetical protein GCM10010321_00940 [Streptomyces chartreusis]|nr:hypothetical protein GCM10010321_00940 [Streptomyces chartreusis]
MGLLPGDDNAVTMLDAAHSSTPAAYNARIRRSCRTTGQDPRDSLCAAMGRRVPVHSLSHLEAEFRSAAEATREEA